MLNWLGSFFGQNSDNITATVEIYTWQTCPYCIAAKVLLFIKGAKFTEYKIDGFSIHPINLDTDSGRGILVFTHSSIS